MDGWMDGQITPFTIWFAYKLNLQGLTTSQNLYLCPKIDSSVYEVNQTNNLVKKELKIEILFVLYHE